MSEIFPNRIRAKAMAFCKAIHLIKSRYNLKLRSCKPVTLSSCMNPFVKWTPKYQGDYHTLRPLRMTLLIEEIKNSLKRSRECCIYITNPELGYCRWNIVLH
ncbi:hypothetical protein Droror1_Dr00026764 [Drosera rotundifolia]